jgi:hypothetical protein
LISNFFFSFFSVRPCEKSTLPVGLGDALNLVLLLDGVRVGAALGGVDDLLSKALGDGLDGPEGSLPEKRKKN